MTGKHHLVLGLALSVILGLAGLAAACGGGGGEKAPAATARPVASHMQHAMDQMSTMVAAAEKGDLKAAEAAFEDGHDALHDVISELKASNPGLAEELDKAVDDAEKDFKEGADADHMVKIGKEILGLLDKAK